jgi:pyruvate kinase
MSEKLATEIESIIARLQPFRLAVLQAEEHFREELDRVYLGNLQSARNLVHYLSLRRHDIRELHQDLGGLRSVHWAAWNPMRLLRSTPFWPSSQLAGKQWPGRPIEETFAEFDAGSALLEKHAIEALGETPEDRDVDDPNSAVAEVKAEGIIKPIGRPYLHAAKPSSSQLDVRS